MTDSELDAVATKLDGHIVKGFGMTPGDAWTLVSALINDARSKRRALKEIRDSKLWTAAGTRAIAEKALAE